MISDLGSANGTFVNDQRLTDPFPLAGGDVIRLFVPELTFSAAVSEADQQAASTHGTLIVPVGAGGHPHLSVTSGPQEGMEIDLAGDAMTIGRATAKASWRSRSRIGPSRGPTPAWSRSPTPTPRPGASSTWVAPMGRWSTARRSTARPGTSCATGT